MFKTNNKLRKENCKLKRECDDLKFTNSIMLDISLTNKSWIGMLETKIKLLEKELREVKLKYVDI